MRLLLAAILLVGLSSLGCAQKGLYDWDDYEDDLYDLYKKPESAPEFYETLFDILETSRKNGARPPPGVAAEFAYLQYSKGDSDKAVEYFDLERRLYPESAYLMTTLINRVQSEDDESPGGDAPAYGPKGGGGSASGEKEASGQDSDNGHAAAPSTGGAP